MAAAERTEGTEECVESDCIDSAEQMEDESNASSASVSTSAMAPSPCGWLASGPAPAQVL